MTVSFSSDMVLEILGLFAAHAWTQGDVHIGIELQGDAWYGLLTVGGEQHPAYAKGRGQDAYMAVVHHFVGLIAARLQSRGYTRAVQTLQENF